VATFLADLREHLARTIGPTIELQVLVSRDMPDINVDPSHLQTALLNLAINAGHAMPDGGRLVIEAKAHPQPGSREGVVVIAMTDTGVGMDPVTLARATEPFFTTKGPGGTGLGLPMAQGFARQSGGDLRLTSVVGQGTRVELVLPAFARTCLLLPDPTQTADGAGRVLVVDDVADVLDGTARFLRRAGFLVTSAADGDAALALLASGARFDVLVTDYAMPGLSGVDLVSLAREMQFGLPAIVVTGFAEVDLDRISTIAAVLRKPFSAEQLVGTVRQLLARRAIAG
jgi:CheY-like chemotaxis protein